eukprot:TRINITY_DN4415_c0_g1_i1.p1 TRINITY_DN4415_c0_g1~~TRINITY_DN4415_c0_g1_i1.p1  ORF type:complete len:476 (+),score=104.05 TRINITY_DN4415_c0_g1_i1:22-1449(+)
MDDGKLRAGAAAAAASAPLLHPCVDRDPVFEKAAKFNAEPFIRKFGLSADSLMLYDCHCALDMGRMSYPGRLYLSQHFICFYSKTFGSAVKEVIPLCDVRAIGKKSKPVLRYGIQIVAVKDKIKTKYFFDSFVSRGACLAKLQCLLKHCDCNVTLTDDLSTSFSGTATPMPSANTASEGDPHETYEPSNPEDDVLLTEELPHADFLKSELQEVVRETLPAGGVNTIFKHMFSGTESGMAFTHAFHTSQGDTELVITEWVPTPGVGNVRRKHYRVKIENQPLAPPTTRIDETQRYGLTKNQLTVETTLVMLDIPYGDYFQVEAKWVFTGVSDSSSEIVISLGVTFHKKTLFRGKIESSANKQAKESYVHWLAVARDWLAKAQLTPAPQRRASLTQAPSSPPVPQASFKPTAVVAPVAVRPAAASPALPPPAKLASNAVTYALIAFGILLLAILIKDLHDLATRITDLEKQLRLTRQ